MPKDERHKKRKKEMRRNPLFKDIEDSTKVKQKQKATIDKKSMEEDDEREEYLPQSLSKKLLKQVQEQQEEEEEFARPAPLQKGEKKQKKQETSEEHFLELETPVESEDEEPEQDFFEGNEITDIDPSDEAALAFFIGNTKQDQPKSLDIGSLILQKIQEKELQVSAASSSTTSAPTSTSTLDPKVIAVYTQIAQILQHFRSGRLPKAVKILPLLSNWEEVLALTRPENWSPTALRLLTRIFASNFNEKMAQRFYNIVLLPRARDDIRFHKKLNWHIYMSLKKALYKPTAFYKGVLLPLCESRDCTLKEALIIGSVIKKVSVPAVQSSVALLKIASMPYSGANSIFIRVFLEKKYALPFKVIDALVEHFLKFNSDDRKMPVIWHQSLLAFAQRYKEDITAEQKQQLKLLMRKHTHPQVSPEIRRELFSTKCRGEPAQETSGSMDVGD